MAADSSTQEIFYENYQGDSQLIIPKGVTCDETFQFPQCIYSARRPSIEVSKQEITGLTYKISVAAIKTCKSAPQRWVVKIDNHQFSVFQGCKKIVFRPLSYGNIKIKETRMEEGVRKTNVAYFSLFFPDDKRKDVVIHPNKELKQLMDEANMFTEKADVEAFKRLLRTKCAEDPDFILKKLGDFPFIVFAIQDSVTDEDVTDPILKVFNWHAHSLLEKAVREHDLTKIKTMLTLGASAIDNQDAEYPRVPLVIDEDDFCLSKEARDIVSETWRYMISQGADPFRAPPFRPVITFSSRGISSDVSRPANPYFQLISHGHIDLAMELLKERQGELTPDQYQFGCAFNVHKHGDWHIGGKTYSCSLQEAIVLYVRDLVEQDDLEKVHLLLSMGIVNFDCATPWVQLIQSQNLDLLTKMLGILTPTNPQLLMEALDVKNEVILKKLIDVKINPNEKTTIPYHIKKRFGGGSIQGKCSQMVADLFTPLHVAVILSDISLVKILLKSDHCKTSIDERYDICETMKRHDAEETIKRYGVYVPPLGDTALHMALKTKRMDIVVALVNAGASLSIPGREGNYPLHIAVEDGDKELVRWLLTSGAEASGMNDYKETPLHLAIKKKNIHMVELLLEHLSDIVCDDSKWVFSSETYDYERNLDMIYLLLSKGIKPKNVMFCRTISRNINPTYCKSHSYMPLSQYLIEYNSFKILELLVKEKGFDINTRCELTGETILHSAVKRYCPLDEFKKYMNLGAEPWLKDNNGNTVIDILKEKLPREHPNHIALAKHLGILDFRSKSTTAASSSSARASSSSARASLSQLKRKKP